MRSKDKKIDQTSQQLLCQVCRQKHFDNKLFEKLVCKSCQRWVHRYCFAPDWKDSKNFKCDECRKGVRAKCDICQKNNGILKEVPATNHWVHILCAFSSPRIKIVSYRYMEFKMIASSNPPSKGPIKKWCPVCKHKKADEGIQCAVENCSYYAHLDCLLSYMFQGQTECHPIFGLLDNNTGSLIPNLGEQARQLKGLSFVQHPKRNLRLFVCHNHDDDPHLIWCPCGVSRYKDGFENETQVSCDSCKRWFHRDCSGIQHNDDDYECRGCSQNDIFVKLLELPQLIEKIVEIEARGITDKFAVKILDSFIFKLSDTLTKLILDKNSFEVERYFLRQILQKNYSKIGEEDEKARNLSQPVLLQILVYFIKRELKDPQQISLDELKQCLNQMNNRNNKLDWSDSKIQVRYKRFLEDKVISLGKNDTRDVKSRLQRYVKLCKDGQIKGQHTLAKQFRDLVLMIEKNEVIKSHYLDPREEFTSNLFEIFYDSKITESQLTEVFKNLRTILQSKSTLSISQNDYNNILQKRYSGMKESKQRLLINLYRELLKDYRILIQHQQKQEILRRLEQKLIDQNVGYNEVNIMREKVIQRGLFIEKNSPFMREEIKQIKFQITKRKCFKICSDPSPSNLEQVIQQIENLLGDHQKGSLLSHKEKAKLNNYINKYKLYSNLIKYNRDRKEFQKKINPPPYQIMQEEKSEIQSSDQEGAYIHHTKKVPRVSNKSLLQVVTNAMLEWDKSQNSTYYALNQFYLVAKNNIDFGSCEQAEIFNTFADNVLQQVSRLLQKSQIKIKPQLAQRLYRILIFTQSENYPHLLNYYNIYTIFINEFSQKYSKIEEILENHSKSQLLLKDIESKLDQVTELPLDFSSELRKIKLLKMWAIISTKFLSNRHPTINAVQNIKSLMDKVNYPSNSVRKEIQSLDIESRALNVRLSKFLQKTKIADFQIYQQLKYLSSKMTYEQAENLKKDLQKTVLDVSVQLDELEQQMKQFNAIPKSLILILETSAKGEKLSILRRRILQSPFRYENLQQYALLIQKLNQIRCEEFQGPTTRKQYYRLLNTSGAGSLYLLESTPDLYNAYSQITRAERELLSGKPKLELLLPVDNKKLKHDLREDASERVSLDKIYANFKRLKDLFKHYRGNKTELDKYIILENQISKIPINSKEILSEIGRIRRDAEDLTQRVQRIFSLGRQQFFKNCYFDNPQYSQLIHRYRTLNVRIEYIDRFDDIITKARQISDFSRNVHLGNYKIFSHYCQQYIQIQKNNEIAKLREQNFFKIYALYISSPEPLIEVGHTLLAEGGFLCNQFTQKAGEIIPLMLNVNTKLFKATIEQEQQRQRMMKEVGSQGSCSEEEDDIDLQDDDEDIDEEDDDQIDEDEDDLDEDLIDQMEDDEDELVVREISGNTEKQKQGVNGKRKRDKDDIVDLGDD